MIATKRTAAAKRTPYCDTCYRKGLPEKEYTSHYTKSEPGPRGVIVCPTILNTVCRACGMKGHWANEKFCSVVRREMKEREDKERRTKDKERQERIVTKPVVKTNCSRFSALVEEEEQEENTEKAEKVVTAPSWADMAAKKPEPKERHGQATCQTFTPLTDAQREVYRRLNERQALGVPRKRNWVEIQFDDDEEE